MRKLGVTQDTHLQTGQIYRAQYELNYDSTAPRVCIIA